MWSTTLLWSPFLVGQTLSVFEEKMNEEEEVMEEEDEGEKFYSQHAQLSYFSEERWEVLGRGEGQLLKHLGSSEVASRCERRDTVSLIANFVVDASCCSTLWHKVSA